MLPLDPRNAYIPFPTKNAIDDDEKLSKDEKETMRAQHTKGVKVIAGWLTKQHEDGAFYANNKAEQLGRVRTTSWTAPSCSTPPTVAPCSQSAAG